MIDEFTKAETDNWKIIFKETFTELMGEFLPFDYNSLADQCVLKYGYESSAEKAAKEQASYYD